MTMNKRNNKSQILRLTTACIALTLSQTMMGKSLIFEGGSHKEIEIIPEKNTGIDAVYISYNLVGTSIAFESDSDMPAKWYRFSNLGGAFSEPIDDIVYDGKKSILNAPAGDMGYIITDNNKSYYFWLVDYSKYPYNVNSISASDIQDCESTILNIDGTGNAIYFYSINGQRETISRDIDITYNSLEWDNENKQFCQIEITKKIPYISEEVSLTPPALTQTYFTISGDRFSEIWNDKKSVESQLYYPHSVAAYTEAIQYKDDADEDSSNQITPNDDGLGGSAPANIEFRAYVTDAVIHSEWQMATDMNFENITNRFYEQDLDYIFTEEGKTFVRFIGSNSDGSCETYGDTYIVNIGASDIRIPNAFSPNNDGINDIWKVSYRSILNFDCRIFDRQGHEIYRFTNPDDGWDGKHKGKLVKPGVYFYVIRAKGADGKEYKKSGDINILRFKGVNSSSSSSD